MTNDQCKCIMTAILIAAYLISIGDPGEDLTDAAGELVTKICSEYTSMGELTN